jgi:hypothetical protein
LDDAYINRSSLWPLNKSCHLKWMRIVDMNISPVFSDFINDEPCLIYVISGACCF